MPRKQRKQTAFLDRWRDDTLRAFLLPGGIVLFAVAAALSFDFPHISMPVAKFCYAGGFVAGLLLAWRFHSTRIFFALSIILLAHLAQRALPTLVAGATAQSAVDVASFLLPLNFVGLCLFRERGFVPSAIASRLLVLFFQCVFVGLLFRPDHVAAANFLHVSLLNPHWFSWTRIPQLSLLAFAACLATFLVRFYLQHKPVESGFFWSLVAVFLAFQSGMANQKAIAYLATSGVILAVAVVETSYLMAYHDELTGLPGRRAFNQAILGLPERYAVAVVDVDHFKQFNDKYGHETGDNVLRMVASRLAQVTGGGKAFRCGGEEFAILFPDKSADEVLDDLELLRESIENSSFHLRSRTDRRRKPRGGDRRKSGHLNLARAVIRQPRTSLGRKVSVTVSIGVAEPSTRDREIDQVIRSADKALYRAKEAGRNRVESGSTRARARTKRATVGSEAGS